MNSKLNFMKTRVFMTGAMALSLLSSCDKDDNKPTLENEEELRRWMDRTADPKKFARWLDWAMTYESTNY